MSSKLYTFLIALLNVTVPLIGQEIIPLAFDIKGPIDINMGADQNLWITESGSGNDDGQVLRMDMDYTIDTIITGLPSSLDPATMAIDGPWSAQLLTDGRIILVQGKGPNPDAASIIEFLLSDYEEKGSALVLSEQTAIAKVGEWALAEGYAESNPYTMTLDETGNYIIADAAANALFKFDINLQSFSTIADLPATPNPLPFGPPMVEPVPTKVLTNPEGGWLVAAYTGFPFPSGGSNIYSVQEDGTTELYQGGFTLLGDMEFDPNDGNLVVQQFARFETQPDSSLNYSFASAELIKIDASGNLDTLLSNYGPSAGMAIGSNGAVYMTHLFLGQLLKVEAILSSTFDQPVRPTEISVYPNPNEGIFQTSISLTTATALEYHLVDQMGRTITRGDLGNYPAGFHPITFNFNRKELSKGIYALQIIAENRLFLSRVILK